MTKGGHINRSKIRNCSLSLLRLALSIFLSLYRLVSSCLSSCCLCDVSFTGGEKNFKVLIEIPFCIFLTIIFLFVFFVVLSCLVLSCLVFSFLVSFLVVYVMKLLQVENEEFLGINSNTFLYLSLLSLSVSLCLYLSLSICCLSSLCVVSVCICCLCALCF